MSEFIRLSDDDLIALAKHGFCALDPRDVAKSLADEVLRNRRGMRKDSRRAEQVKKVRWLIENALTKIEALELVVGDETKADVLEDDHG